MACPSTEGRVRSVSMHSKVLAAWLLAPACWLPACASAAAVADAGGTPQYSVLHAFGDGEGWNEYGGGLIADADGNLYGVLIHGGTATTFCAGGCGVVFKLSRGADGQWTDSVLYAFQGGPDGAWPSGIVFDAGGNLLGTTYQGGLGSAPNHWGGTVFKLTPSASGPWTHTVLYSFQGTAQDDGGPLGIPILDAAGNLYATTYGTGISGRGSIFELSPGSDGAWTETVLYNFNTDPSGAGGPTAGLTADAAGNLYGTVQGGAGCGTVYKLSRDAVGAWTYSVLYSFDNTTDRPDVCTPYGGVTLDAQGNLYGAATDAGGDQGNDHAYGGVYRLTHAADGTWSETLLHTFYWNGLDPAPEGVQPTAPLTFDAAGNLYGTTGTGAAPAHDGTVFELSPGADDQWTLRTLHAFDGADGGETFSGVMFDKTGNLYGITSRDIHFPDSNPYGLVFEIRFTFAASASATGGHGTIDPPQATAYRGDTVTFTLTPDPGYEIGTVGGSCGGSLAGNAYTTLAVTADCTVEAAFTPSGPPDEIFRNGFEMN